MKENNKLTNVGYKFVKFLKNLGCILIKDYKKIIDDVYSLDDIYNIFISINGYEKGIKDRTQEYINRINFFFLDIDCKDNLDFCKNEIKEKIFEFEKDFIFIVETKNGFHLYIQINDVDYRDQNGKINYKKYLKDWKVKIEYYNNIMGLVFDKNCVKTTQIARVPGSIHKKPNQEEFEIKLLKGEELLEKSTIDLINEIPIKKVLDKLNIKYDEKEGCIYEENQKTNGWKIDESGNYVNDFSGKDRAIGGTFSFVLNYFKKQNGEKNHEKNHIETFNFFKYNFGIIGKSQRSKNIKVNKLISLVLLQSILSQENIKYFLFIQYYLNRNNINDGEKSDFISIKEFKNFIGDEKIKETTILKNLEDLSKNSVIEVKKKLKMRNGDYLKEFKFIDIQIKKDKGIKLQFCILPCYEEIQKILFDSNYYHFYNSKILELSTNNTKIVYFYLFLFKKVILESNQKIFLKNSDIDKFEINKNLSLRNKKLNDFGKLLGDFEFIKKGDVGFEVIKN